MPVQPKILGIGAHSAFTWTFTLVRPCARGELSSPVQNVPQRPLAHRGSSRTGLPKLCMGFPMSSLLQVGPTYPPT